jgi:hypothetical protein
MTTTKELDSTLLTTIFQRYNLGDPYVDVHGPSMEFYDQTELLELDGVNILLDITDNNSDALKPYGQSLWQYPIRYLCEYIERINNDHNNYNNKCDALSNLYLLSLYIQILILSQTYTPGELIKEIKNTCTAYNNNKNYTLANRGNVLQNYNKAKDDYITARDEIRTLNVNTINAFGKSVNAAQKSLFLENIKTATKNLFAWQIGHLRYIMADEITTEAKNQNPVPSQTNVSPILRLGNTGNVNNVNNVNNSNVNNVNNVNNGNNGNDNTIRNLQQELAALQTEKTQIEKWSQKLQGNNQSLVTKLANLKRKNLLQDQKIDPNGTTSSAVNANNPTGPVLPSMAPMIVNAQGKDTNSGKGQILLPPPSTPSTGSGGILGQLPTGSQQVASDAQIQKARTIRAEQFTRINNLLLRIQKIPDIKPQKQILGTITGDIISYLRTINTPLNDPTVSKEQIDKILNKSLRLSKDIAGIENELNDLENLNQSSLRSDGSTQAGALNTPRIIKNIGDNSDTEKCGLLSSNDVSGLLVSLKKIYMRAAYLQLIQTLSTLAERKSYQRITIRRDEVYQVIQQIKKLSFETHRQLMLEDTHINKLCVGIIKSVNPSIDEKSIMKNLVIDIGTFPDNTFQTINNNLAQNESSAE